MFRLWRVALSICRSTYCHQPWNHGATVLLHAAGWAPLAGASLSRQALVCALPQASLCFPAHHRDKSVKNIACKNVPFNFTNGTQFTCGYVRQMFSSQSLTACLRSFYQVETSAHLIAHDTVWRTNAKCHANRIVTWNCLHVLIQGLIAPPSNQFRKRLALIITTQYRFPVWHTIL